VEKSFFIATHSRDYFGVGKMDATKYLSIQESTAQSHIDNAALGDALLLVLSLKTMMMRVDGSTIRNHGTGTSLVLRLDLLRSTDDRDGDTDCLVVVHDPFHNGVPNRGPRYTHGQILPVRQAASTLHLPVAGGRRTEGGFTWTRQKQLSVMNLPVQRPQRP